MRRLLAALVLALMVLPAMAMLIPSTEAQVVLDRSSATGVSFTDANGLTMHLMTKADMLELRNNVGPRVDGVNYDTIVDGYHTGLAPPSSESWESLVGNVLLAQTPETLTLSAPAAYDMSTNSWFPTVGNQGGQGSCAAWAATYYCYGAVEAKDNGWTGSKTGNSAQLLSPAWTYNRVASRSPGGGSWMSENFAVIKDWGVSTLATFPYTDSNAINWGGEAAWRNAPLHRGSDLVFLSISGDATINAIKNLVSADQPITFAINASQFNACFHDDFVISAAEYNSVSGLNHAQTIVGYDDFKVAAGHPDIGAFKIVNSWGTGWGSGGYYWISYDAFKEIMNANGNELCYITDLSDYTPSLLAIWHYNSPPKRNVEHNLMIGNFGSYLGVKTPYWVYDSTNVLPSFMICDISEFRSYYDSGTIKFNLQVNGGGASNISSFRIESYEDGYSPGAPTQVSAQSALVPKTTPGRLENNFPSYSPISAAQALDRSGIDVSNPGLTDWVGVEQTSIYGGSAMQAGDVGDSCTSTIQVNVTGYSGVSFFWRVSSEQSADYLRFYESATKKMEISGNVSWTHVWYNFTSPGTHVLKWAYEKSISISSLQDSAWIDRLQLLPADDAFEPNDVSAQAAVLSAPGNVSGLMLLNDDWYKVNLNEGDSLIVTARFNGSAGNLDMYLYSTDASTLLNSATHTSGDSESVSVDGVLASGYYYLKVAPVNSDITNYSLQLERSSGVPDCGTTSSLSLTSGTGSFSTISESNKRVIAFAGQSLSGGLSFDFINAWPADTTPLILAYTWGAHSSSYQLVYANLSAGSGSGTATISGLVVPTAPGTCYLIFAFRNESDSVQVASATSTLYGPPVWNDGNDIADFSTVQISDAQSSGRTTGSWLMINGLHWVKVPGDAISIRVILNESTPPITHANCIGEVGSNGWYNSAVNIVLTASDSGSGVNETRYRVDSSSWYIYDGAFHVSGNGQHLVDYYSTDFAGNVESVKSTLIRIDSGDPVSSVNLAGTMGSGNWYLTDVQVTITSLDGVSGISTIIYRLDGSGEQSYTGPFVVSTEGVHTIGYYAVDVAGNIENERSVQFKVDTVVPTVSGLLEGVVGDEGWFISSVMVTIRGNDASSGIDIIMYQLDGGSWSNYYSTIEVSEEGDHDIAFYAVDQAGNHADTVNLTFSIDATIPTAQSMLTGETGQNGWYVSEVAVNLTAQDNLSGVATLLYRLDGSDWMEYSTDLSINVDGQHTVDFFAIDRAGNNGTIGSVVVMLDSTGPASSCELNGTPGQMGWYISSISINASARDGNGSGIASIEYRLDGGSWDNYSSAIRVQSEGEHVMECRAIDIAGNIGPVQSLDFMLDTVAPESLASIIGVVGEQGWYVSAVDLTIIASDNTSGVSHTYMRVNEGDWNAGNASEFDNGTYLIEFYSTDNAGNSGPAVSVVIKSDFAAPSTSHQVVGTIAENGWYTSNVSLDLSADDAVSGVGSTHYRLEGGDWVTYLGSIAFDSEGVHLIEYRSFDLAGNEEPIQSYSVKVDKTAPSSSASIHGSEGVGGWYVSALLINVSSSDDVSAVDFIDYRLDSGAWSVYSGQVAVESCGHHLIEFYSQDRAGNVESVKQIEFRIDHDDPTILAQIDGKVFTSKAVWFNWTANDSTSAVGAIELSIDGAPYQMYGGTQSNITLSGLSDGPHSLLVRVSDLAGNKVVSELSFVVDTNPLSPQGPYGPALLIALVIVVALVAGLVILRFRRRH